ncbi:alkaline phosphatase PhoX [Crocosphaera sp. UHCC 0190]|uniref:alkaline phosphatase PhoX n=1 Tax=Crocosphaera sp. UHCC 0190 TaxID=3110246 RepID=UPI002B21984E|nr:alkaline phosphatase PhoX [Crocosphaera sp. UHCC 0190]MEA5509735.1 alkaline phosphatase PhoX [Crocosphaera sp. UHCC 0190]
MVLSRRNFLSLAGISITTGVAAVSLKNYYTRVANGQTTETEKFGKLISDPNGILDLPKGWQYQVISQVGKSMSDGTSVPTSFDGMAAFPGENGQIILIRNHELSPHEFPGVIASKEHKYDHLSQGGTTTLIINKNRTLAQEFVSLAGTNRNCAGGATPWHSWISCEEEISTPQLNSQENPDNVSVKHGYNFEVSSQSKIAKPIALTAMGRFRHEAIAVDPSTGYIYQTEDQNDSCFYRFRPRQPGNLQAGGILEALVIEEMPSIDTSKNYPLNQPKSVKWVQIENVDPDDDTLRYEAQKKGAAIFKRGEGICLAKGEFYFTCTSGGNAEKGQIFRYNPAKETISLFVESPGAEILDYPDNLTLAPFGDLIVCEDGAGEQFLIGVTPQGECYRLARNAYNNSEFAGVCFSPDGQTMFVNIYSPGLTLAIWADWPKVTGA